MSLRPISLASLALVASSTNEVSWPSLLGSCFIPPTTASRRYLNPASSSQPPMPLRSPPTVSSPSPWISASASPPLDPAAVEVFWAILGAAFPVAFDRLVNCQQSPLRNQTTWLTVGKSTVAPSWHDELLPPVTLELGRQHSAAHEPLLGSHGLKFSSDAPTTIDKAEATLADSTLLTYIVLNALISHKVAASSTVLCRPEESLQRRYMPPFCPHYAPPIDGVNRVEIGTSVARARSQPTSRPSLIAYKETKPKCSQARRAGTNKP
ncbi:hypothetical protein SprV_0902799500 [Sparganum proliferum]